MEIIQIVTLTFWATEHPNGWVVWYRLGNNKNPIAWHGRALPRKAMAEQCVADAEILVQKALSNYKSMMAWFELEPLEPPPSIK